MLSSFSFLLRMVFCFATHEKTTSTTTTTRCLYAASWLRNLCHASFFNPFSSSWLFLLLFVFPSFFITLHRSQPVTNHLSVSSTHTSSDYCAVWNGNCQGCEQRHKRCSFCLTRADLFSGLPLSRGRCISSKDISGCALLIPDPWRGQTCFDLLQPDLLAYLLASYHHRRSSSSSRGTSGRIRGEDNNREVQAERGNHRQNDVSSTQENNNYAFGHGGGRSKEEKNLPRSPVEVGRPFAISAAVVGALILASIVYCLCRQKNKNKKITNIPDVEQLRPPLSNNLQSVNTLHYTQSGCYAIHRLCCCGGWCCCCFPNLHRQETGGSGNSTTSSTHNERGGTTRKKESKRTNASSSGDLGGTTTSTGSSTGSSSSTSGMCSTNEPMADSPHYDTSAAAAIHVNTTASPSNAIRGSGRNRNRYKAYCCNGSTTSNLCNTYTTSNSVTVRSLPPAENIIISSTDGTKDTSTPDPATVAAAAAAAAGH